MKMLGYRNIQNTLLYTQLISFESDEFHSSTAATVQEAQKLIETGFEPRLKWRFHQQQPFLIHYCHSIVAEFWSDGIFGKGRTLLVSAAQLLLLL